MNAILMITNCDTEPQAEQIADELLFAQLAAAIQVIGPVSSRYRWQGAIHKKKEWIVLIKTGDHCEARIKQKIRELHEYELPGIMKINLDGGEAQYLQWILNNSTVMA